jgi:predicted Zn-dependent peptidase
MSKRPYRDEIINGVRTVFFPLKDKEAVQAELWIRAGSEQEDEQWGAFHLLEHMCLRETEAFPNKRKSDNFKESRGLYSNGFTSRDKTGYVCQGPYYELESVLKYLSQVVFHPLLPESRLDKEKNVIRQEYHDAWDNRQRRFAHAIRQKLFGSTHPYIRDALGQPEFVGRQTRADLATLQKNYYTADNVILVVAGKFEMKQARELVKKMFHPQATAERREFVIPPAKTSSEINFHYEDVAQETLVLNWLIPGRERLSRRQRMILHRANYILGSSARSMLYQEIREKRGLAYHPTSRLYHSFKYGIFEMAVSTEPENRDRVLELMRKTLKKYMSRPLSQGVFDRAQAYITAQNLMSFDSLEEIASDLLSEMFYEDSIFMPSDFLKLAKTITKQEVETALNDLVDADTGLLSIMTRGNSG